MCMCVRKAESLGMLAEEMEYHLVCVCVHMFVGGNGWVKNPAQYFVSVYLFKCVMVSKGTTAHVVCVRW